MSQLATKAPLLLGRMWPRASLARRAAELITVLALSASGLLLLPQNDSRRAPPQPVPHRTTQGTLVEALDGDTLLVRIDNKVEKLRLIGADAPESFPNDKALFDSERSHQSVSSITTLGHLASQFTSELVAPGTELRIAFDRLRTDQLGRLLAYVYLPDGSLLNEKILSEGYAALRIVPPNTKLENRLERAFRVAQNDRRGLWRRKDHRIMEAPDFR